MFIKLPSGMVVNTDNVTVITDEYGDDKIKNMYVIGTLDDSFLLDAADYKALLSALPIYEEVK